MNRKRFKPAVVVISGNKRHGKNTLADFIEQNLEKEGIVEQFAYADALRKVCSTLLMLPEDSVWLKELKDAPLPRLFNLCTGRDVLKFVGGLFRKFDADYWAKQLVSRLKESEADYAIITDCRFANELSGLIIPEVRCLVHIRIINPNAPEPQEGDVTEKLFHIADLDKDLPFTYSTYYECADGYVDTVHIWLGSVIHVEVVNNGTVDNLSSVASKLSSSIYEHFSRFYPVEAYQ